MAKQQPLVFTGFKLPSEDLARVDALASSEGATRSALIREALDALLADRAAAA